MKCTQSMLALNRLFLGGDPNSFTGRIAKSESTRSPVGSSAAMVGRLCAERLKGIVLGDV
jgi:hypothetical protein